MDKAELEADVAELQSLLSTVGRERTRKVLSAELVKVQAELSAAATPPPHVATPAAGGG